MQHPPAYGNTASIFVFAFYSTVRIDRRTSSHLRKLGLIINKIVSKGIWKRDEWQVDGKNLSSAGDIYRSQNWGIENEESKMWLNVYSSS